MKEFSTIKSTAAYILSHPTWDVVSIITLVGIGFFYGISAGKRRITSTLIFTYMALAISSALPLEQWFGVPSSMDRFFIRGGAFVGLFLIFSFLLGSRRTKGFAPASAWWQIFLLSFLQAGLLIHIIFGFLPPDKIKLLAPMTKTLFANPQLHIWWLVVPAVVLILFKQFESREG